MAKTFDELTIMDDYMFAQVMRNKKYLCPLLEHILGMKIVDLKFVEPQKTEKEGYESKGVRLDIYVESEDGTIYDVEVQTTDKRNLPKRMRFYQSIMDINFLNKGMDYNALKASYVIFICSYDEVGLNRCVSLFENICRDVPDKRLGDEAYKVIVYTRGNPDGISEELKEALRYLTGASRGHTARSLMTRCGPSKPARKGGRNIWTC